MQGRERPVESAPLFACLVVGALLTELGFHHQRLTKLQSVQLFLAMVAPRKPAQRALKFLQQGQDPREC